MEVVAQLVRALVCGTKGRGFKSPQSPYEEAPCGSLFSFNLPFQQDAR